MTTTNSAEEQILKTDTKGRVRTSAERRLFLAFTVRHNKIRVISVRDMNQNESAIYAKSEKENS